MSLNPFEFRAGIYFATIAALSEGFRLNPFEFRAGIYFAPSAQRGQGLSVLIPLNSGLVFTLRRCHCLPAGARLNPFEFRAGIYLNEGGVAVWRLGLNPFEFRAGIYLAWN